MMENLKPFVAICFFKYEQSDTLENTPLSKALLFYALIAMAIQINFHGALIASIAVCLEMILTLGFMGLVVFYNKLWEDFIPLSCAVFVCTGFIASLGIPFTLMLYVVKGKLALFLYYSIVALIIWNITVIKYVFEKILKVIPLRGFILAMSYFLVAYVMPYLVMLIL